MFCIGMIIHIILGKRKNLSGDGYVIMRYVETIVITISGIFSQFLSYQTNTILMKLRGYLLLPLPV